MAQVHVIVTIGQSIEHGSRAKIVAERAIDQMPVVDGDGRLLGLLDVQDLLNLKIG